MKPRLLLSGLLGSALAGSAFAADLSVTSSVTGPVTTSNASNGAGNITVQTGGTITMGSAGATVTVDSNNTVNNSGTITNTAASDAIALRLRGGVTAPSTIINSGSIVVSGTGANNIGILVDGPGTFTGDIVTNAGSTVAASGIDSAGVAIRTGLAGNFSNGGSVTGTGLRASGVVTTAAISGTFTNSGTISSLGASALSSTEVDPLPGSSVAIGANIGGGFLNAGPPSSSVTTPTAATISTLGSAPALLISPRVAGAAAGNVVIGLLASDATNPSFGLVNRGTISATSTDPGINTTAVEISGDGAFTTTIDGGIFNRGSITSTANSSNLTATNAQAAAADAVAMRIGAGANAQRLVNEGNIAATTQGTKGGTATGLLIDAGGTLTEVTNTGSLGATATTTDTSITGLAGYGIRDLSGTLGTITNSGSMGAVVSELNTNTETRVAADLSARTGATTFFNSGTVGGDILFGSGANVLTIDDEDDADTNNDGALTVGSVRAAPGGTLTINLTDGSLRTQDIRATTLNVGAEGSLDLSLSAAAASNIFVQTTGDITFADGGKLNITPVSFLPDTTTYTLLQSSGGAVTFANQATAIAFALPFLYNGTFSVTSNQVSLTLDRKSASELGLSGNLAAIYEPLAQAATLDDEIGAALLALDSASDVTAAIDALLPDASGGSRAIAVALTDSTTGPVAGRQRGLASTEPSKRGFGFWAQEFYDHLDGSSTGQSNGYFGSGQGIAVGGEWGRAETGRYGAAFTFFAGQSTEKNPRSSKSSMEWHIFSGYGGWRWDDVFVASQASVGLGEFEGKRTAIIGSVTRSTIARWTSYLASASLSTGYIFQVGDFRIIPQISIDGMFLWEGSRTEGGGGNAVNLTIEPDDQKSLRAFMGVVAQAGYPFIDGSIQPELVAGYSHELLDDTPIIDAYFESVPGSKFSIAGPQLEKSRVVGGAGVFYVLRNWSAGFNYDASATSDSLAQSATLTLSSKF